MAESKGKGRSKDVQVNEGDTRVTVQEPAEPQDFSGGRMVGVPDRDEALDAKQNVLGEDAEGRMSVAEGEASAEASNEQVAARLQPEQEAGYYGFSPDPTPDTHYTASGVNMGLPTPETDPELKAQARANLLGEDFPTSTRPAKAAKTRADDDKTD